MAAAAEAMRIRRNISVLLFEREMTPQTPAHRAEPRVCPKPRARELRALDLDQTNLTFIYVNDCSITAYRADAAVGVSCRDSAHWLGLRPSPLSLDCDSESPRLPAP